VQNNYLFPHFANGIAGDFAISAKISICGEISVTITNFTNIRIFGFY